MGVVTFTTDFGTEDWFVGAMKGVVLSRAPRTALVDLTHAVEPGDVRGGAFALAAACRFFPRGTVHVAIVDPGVGSARKAIAVRTADYYFVGPDNGVLSLALARERVRAVHRLENARCFLPAVSATFHGRDVFAPVAAHLSRGGRISALGPRQEGWTRLPWPEPVATRNGWRGVVVHLDRFGNAISNLPASLLRPSPAEGWQVRLRGRVGVPLGAFYQAVPAGRAVAVIGSTGFVELAVNGGNAAERFGLRRGSTIELRRAARGE
jgi:S-adenosylmethionine hydrolase